MNINMSSGHTIINGQKFKGNNISINNGKVIVDGEIQNGSLINEINVAVHGSVQILETQSGNVIAQNVGEINTGSGDVECVSVTGSIRTGSGDVNCGDVGGNIRTGSGDVTHK